MYSLGKIGYWLFASKIYNGEKHRDPEFDLTKEKGESWRYYFNDFLDKVTNHDPDKRLSSTASMITEFEYAQRAIDESIGYLDLTVDQSCAFCGYGKYRDLGDNCPIPLTNNSLSVDKTSRSRSGVPSFSLTVSR
ncbi:MAG: hypothetical protein V3U60_09915 [Gammaproteobacteria bacterium]